MDFNFGNARERAVQQTLLFNRIVNASSGANAGPPVQVSDDLDGSRLITTFMVNNYSDAPDSVFLGVTPGMHASIEIVPGACPVFTAFQEGRQLYELQVLIYKIASQEAKDLVKIPIIVWDLTQWWLLAGGSQQIEVAVTAFPLPYL